MSEAQRPGVYALRVMGGLLLFGFVGGLGILGYGIFSPQVKLERERRKEYSLVRNSAYFWADENKDMVLDSDEMSKFAKELGVLSGTEIIPIGKLEGKIAGANFEQLRDYVDKKAKERSEELKRREK